MTRDWTAAVAAMPSSFGPWADRLAMTVVMVTPDRFEVSWTATPQMYQPFGLVNGGVHCTVTETLGSFAAAIRRLDASLPDDAPVPDLSDPTVFPTVVGVSNQTDLYRPLRRETVTSTAVPIHAGRLQQVWQVDTVDDAQRLVARGQLRIQNL